MMRVISALCLLFILSSVSEGREPQDAIVFRTIMGEAVSEGYEGMYAVACVIRNKAKRHNLLPAIVCRKWFIASKRKDLISFCERQGVKYNNMVQRIVSEVFDNDAKDITGGATHYENVERYGTPYWAKTMRKTAKIGSHTFWKE